MRQGRESIDYLRDILDAIEKVEQFTERTDFEQFRCDAKTVFAVVRALEIIGEAANKVSPTVKRRYSGVPWRDISDFRNKLAHEYFGVNLNVVWIAVQRDLPRLKPMVASIIREVESQGESS